jgi:TonB family protein
VPSVLTFSDIVSRQIHVEWHESVAAVRALIDTFTAADDRNTEFPALDEIYLSADGEVSFGGRSMTGEAHRWAGGVLQTLLSRTEPPVQLRLVALQATAAVTTLSSLAELNEALAYFERPHRRQVLQGLYNRASDSQPDATVLPPVLPSAHKPPAEPKRPRKPRKPVRVSKRLVAAVAAVAILLAAAVGAGWYITRVRPEAAAAGSEAFSRAADSLGDVVLSGVSKVTETAGLGRLVPPDAPPSPPPAATPAPASSGRDIRLPARPRAARETEAPPKPEFVAFDLEASNAPVPVVPPEVANDAPAQVEISDLDDSLVYSAGSSGVEPPIGIRPHFARELPSTLRAEDLARVELVIATDGSIESARLLDPPRNVIDSLVVSAAKAWSFEPATKDGRPVRYRKTVWVRSR